MDNISAKKSLGQNFLKDDSVLARIASSFSFSSSDLIIEIGPGKGALTKYLSQTKASVLCYEVDTRMESVLSSFCSERCKIIFDDFLKRNIKEDIGDDFDKIFVIANIPYYITTPIITHILDSKLDIAGMTLLVQKEVAERFSASVNSKNYGYFTVLLNHYFHVEKLFDVPPTSFNPPPKVWSSVVRLTRKETILDIDVSLFDDFLKKAFSQKRKTLKNNLKNYDFDRILPILEKHGLSNSVRAEEISYQIFVELFRKLV